MSLQEKIEEAWVEYSESSPLMKNRENFEAGYRAALRGLYVEVKLEDVKRDEIYWFLQNGEHGHEWVESLTKRVLGVVKYRRGDFSTAPVTDAIKIVEFVNIDIPSPSEVFGEEG